MLHIRLQQQRQDGSLGLGPVKTRAGKRDLPLVDIMLGTFDDQERRLIGLRAFSTKWPAGDTKDALVFPGDDGQPMEPSRLVRTFRRICGQSGIRIIRVHDVRHTTATLLKNYGVPARDAQLIAAYQ